MGRERCWGRGGFISIVNVHPQTLAFGNSLPACICWSARGERNPGIGSDQMALPGNTSRLARLEAWKALMGIPWGKRSWGSHGPVCPKPRSESGEISLWGSYAFSPSVNVQPFLGSGLPSFGRSQGCYPLSKTVQTGGKMPMLPNV